MNITDYKKKYLKYKAKYLNIKGGTPQSEPKMNIDKAKAAVRNINFLITAFLPKDNIIGVFNMTGYFSESESKVVYEDIVTPHTFEYYRINSFSYEKSKNGINNSVTNKQNYNTLVDGLTNFGFIVKNLKDYNTCKLGNCTPILAKEYMNKLMYINAIYILSILNYDYIYKLYQWLIKYGKEEEIKINGKDILNSIFALKLAIYYLIINSKDTGYTYASMSSDLGLNNNAACKKLFFYKKIVAEYRNQINNINQKCEKTMVLDTDTEPKKGLTTQVEINEMLPFIYSLIQEIYDDNRRIYNFGKTFGNKKTNLNIDVDVDINDSSTTKYNFDSFNGIPPIIIYRSLYVNDSKDMPYYAEITHSTKPFSIVKVLGNKYIPIGCKQDGTIAYAFVA